MTLREPYVPSKKLSKTADQFSYWFGAILKHDEEKVNRGGAPYLYLEDETLIISEANRLIDKIDKMEKALEGYASGKWAKEALE